MACVIIRSGVCYCKTLRVLTFSLRNFPVSNQRPIEILPSASPTLSLPTR